jgi:uridine kinase
MRTTDPRHALLQHLADRILSLPPEPVLRVGIDGVDGAGKTMFADELALVLQPSGRPLIRASVDAFHNPRAVRYRRGRGSPEGFFRDSYDYATLKALLLDPLSPGGSGRYRRTHFDHTTDTLLLSPEEQAPPGAILLFDGIFLHRPELRDYWDFSIFLHVDFPISITRCALRDAASPDPDTPSNRRYVEGQQLYLRECEPVRRATVVVNNEVLERPHLMGV